MCQILRSVLGCTHGWTDAHMDEQDQNSMPPANYVSRGHKKRIWLRNILRNDNSTVKYALQWTAKGHWEQCTDHLSDGN